MSIGRRRVSSEMIAGSIKWNGTGMRRNEGATTVRRRGAAGAKRVIGAFLQGLAIVVLLAGQTPARAEQLGTSTGLALPRYVSLKSDRVNLREGPSKDHRTNWVFQRAGLPVEITAEFDTWRKIRDSEGSEGWVLHSLLSGRRTALIAPWKKDIVLPLRQNPAEDARVVANLQPGVLGNVKRCDGHWCRIFGEGFDGYMQQTNLWGVYPDEHID
nr:SH3 domain-containing protein [Lichenihabitans psoromatis]